MSAPSPAVSHRRLRPSPDVPPGVLRAVPRYVRSQNHCGHSACLLRPGHMSRAVTWITSFTSFSYGPYVDYFRLAWIRI